MFTTIIFIIVLGILVLVHEFGHFYVAKKAGMKVEEFGFGFPPRIFGIKRGETIYSINWIPFGGFVKIYGENGENENDPRSFASKSAGSKAKVIVAGVIMNFLLAVIFLSFANRSRPFLPLSLVTVSWESAMCLSSRRILSKTTKVPVNMPSFIMSNILPSIIAEVSRKIAFSTFFKQVSVIFKAL